MPTKWFNKFFSRHSDSQPLHASSWKHALEKNPLSKEEFCHLCKDAVYELFPNAQIENGESFDQLRLVCPGREPSTVFLENIWRECRQSVGSRVPRVERFLRAMISTLSENEPVQRQSVVPMIKDEGYFNISKRNKEGEVPFANEHFVGDLWIVYAIDLPNSMKSLMKSELEELGLNSSDLRTIAIENLRRILPPIEQHGEGPVFMLTAGADYVASLLLLKDLWTDLKKIVEGDLLAAVPSRDVLLFTGSESLEGIAELKKSIGKVMQAGGYLISNTILRLTDEGWEIASLN